MGKRVEASPGAGDSGLNAAALLLGCEPLRLNVRQGPSGMVVLRLSRSMPCTVQEKGPLVGSSFLVPVGVHVVEYVVAVVVVVPYLSVTRYRSAPWIGCHASVGTSTVAPFAGADRTTWP